MIASASGADLDRCRALGADIALDYRDSELGRLISAAVPDGVDMHLDTSGNQDLGGLSTCWRDAGGSS